LSDVSTESPDPSSTGPDFFICNLLVDDLQAPEIIEWVIEAFEIYPIEQQKPGSREVLIEVYLTSEVEASLVGNAIENQFATPIGPIRFIPAQDWTSFWKIHFQPLAIGEGLWLHAPWHEEPIPDARMPICINPGLSFGTGKHFTTRFCLEQIQHLYPTFISEAGHPPSVFDAGTGSAVIAITAAKMGASPVIGVDYDPLAIDSAKENLELNGVVNSVELKVQDLCQTPIRPARFDIVFANIYSLLLIQLAEDLVHSANHFLVCTGIRAIEADSVATAFSDLGVKQITVDSDQEWCGMVFDCRK